MPSNPPSLSPHNCPSPVIHWDNACSYNLTNNKDLFSSLFALPNPIPIGGVGGSCIATHAGYLNCLPSLNYINLALYCPSAPQTLLSLGHLHQCGGGFCTSPNNLTLSIFANPSTLLDTTTLQPNCNLYPTALRKLYTTLRSNPTLQKLPTHKPTLSPFFRHFVHHHPPSTIPSLHLSGFLAQTVHITAKQKARVLEAIDLHITRAHPPDSKLCRDLSLGKVPDSTITPTDIHLMRKVCGPCPQCPEGRGNKTSSVRLPSPTPPTTHAGETISFDPQKLPCPVLGGFTQKVLMVDKHTGHTSQPGLPSKTTKALFNGILKIIQQRFNAHGHRVETLHGDAERVNTALTPYLGLIGTKLKVSYPGYHAHRAERTTQTIDGRARSLTASLPYHLPPELTLLLDQSIGETLNNSICKASDPLTPNEALSGFRPQRAPIQFGRCVMVPQPDDKRIAISRSTGTPLHRVPVTELGVSMGLQPGTDHTLWLLANGLVVPRIPTGPLLPPHFIPFNWKPKPVIPLIPNYDSINIEDNKDPHQHHPNVTIQLPEISPSVAIHTMIPLPSPAPLHQIISSPPATLPLRVPAFPNQPSTLQQLLPSTAPSTASPSTVVTPTTPTVPLIIPSSPPPTPNNPITDQFPSPVHVSPSLPATPTRQQPTELVPSPAQFNTPSATPHTPPPMPRSPQYTSAPPPPSTTQTHPPLRLQPRARLPPGFWANSTANLAVPTTHLQRKAINLRLASTRDRIHKLSNPPPPSLTNRSTDIRPSPPARQQNEFPLKKALLLLDHSKVKAAVDKEMDKVFTKFHTLRLITPAQVEPNAVFLRNKLILREKTNKDVTARLALDGSQQPPHTYGATHAGTSDSTHRSFVLATSLADSTARAVPLISFDFDIPGAFLNKNPLTREHTGNTQLCTRMTKDLPPPYGGALCEIVGAHYGLKQSNHIYDQDLIKLLTDDGFQQTPSHPYTFIKFSATNPSDKIIVSMHVDDGDGNTTSQTMYSDFKTLIQKRYGPIDFHSPSRGTCGQIQVVNPDNSITLHYGPYILKMLTRIGMDSVPPALSPDVEGLFSPSTDPTPLSPLATAEFRTTNGELIHLLPARHDIRKVVTHLLKLGDQPDNSAYLKQLHLLRYLKGTPLLGPTFSTNPPTTQTASKSIHPRTRPPNDRTIPQRPHHHRWLGWCQHCTIFIVLRCGKGCIPQSNRRRIRQSLESCQGSASLPSIRSRPRIPTDKTLYHAHR